MEKEIIDDIMEAMLFSANVNEVNLGLITRVSIMKDVLDKNIEIEGRKKKKLNSRHLVVS